MSFPLFFFFFFLAGKKEGVVDGGGGRQREIAPEWEPRAPHELLFVSGMMSSYRSILVCVSGAVGSAGPWSGGPCGLAALVWILL